MVLPPSTLKLSATHLLDLTCHSKISFDSPEQMKGASTTLLESIGPTDLCYVSGYSCELAVMPERPNKGLRRTMRAHVNSCRKHAKNSSEGYVYIVSKDSQNNCFKIGFSACEPFRRFTRHRKCYKSATLIMQTRKINFARRVEQLAHWELDDYRQREYCAECDCVHREWFNISEDMARKAIVKWGLWTITHRSGRKTVEGSTFDRATPTVNKPTVSECSILDFETGRE